MTSAADRVGAGLATAREARPIRQLERIHVVGAAGAGASAAALLAAGAGALVSGCDPGGPSPYTPALEALGIEVAPEHAAEHVTGGRRPDRLAVTKALTAIDPDNPELLAARAAGDPGRAVAAGRRRRRRRADARRRRRDARQEHDGRLAGPRPRRGRRRPVGVRRGAAAGATLTGGPPATARHRDGRRVRRRGRRVRRQLRRLPARRRDPRPARSGTTPTCSPTRRRRRRVRGLAAAGCPTGRTIVANVGDAGVEDVVDRLRGRALRDRRLRDRGRGARPRRVPARASATGSPRPRGRPRRCSAGSRRPSRTGRRSWSTGSTSWPGRSPCGCATAGRHNAANALAVAGAAASLGLAPASIADGLAAFAGVGRRLERKGEAAGVTVYDDYGHHPTAIRETLAAIRQREPGRRVWAVYEPLTYHRTAAMLDAFADALAGADAVAIADIWAGRDPDTTITSAAALAEAVATRRPRHPGPRPGQRRGDRGRARRGRPTRRRRPGDGRRPVVPDRGAPARTAGGEPMIDYARGGDLVGGVRRGPGVVRRRRLGRRCSPRMPSTMRTRSAHRTSVTTPCGRSCSMRRTGNATSTSRWNGTGSPARRCSPRGTPSWKRRSDGSVERIAGFLTADLADDGRISRLHEWWMAAPTTAG